MRRILTVGCAVIAIVVLPTNAQQGQDLVEGVLKKLNSDKSVAGSEKAKSYKVLFDAYLELTDPPFEVGMFFNQRTIHSSMSEWSAVSAWAESNPKMVEAVIECKERNIIGLPYGQANVDSKYVDAGIVAEVGTNDSLRNVSFPYLNVVNTISAFVTAEVYRLMEVGQAEKALDLALAHVFLLRQICDREFLEEKLHSIELLSGALANMRDIFYLYQDKISADQFAKIAFMELPFLRPDRNRLFMPEADRIVSEALLKEVFDARTGAPNEDRFTETFAEIQSKQRPLTRFGAAKRWRTIARIHGSLDASLERLELIYDDWWRRWRIDAYDALLDLPTQFERTNRIRYAAVIASLRDVEVLFEIRNRLIVDVNGTALAAGLCGYNQKFGTYPDQLEKTYTQFVRKRSDSDPYDKELDTFRYRFLGARTAIDTPSGRLWVEGNEGVLYSQGQNHEDDRGIEHTDDGADGDLIVWPPMKALSREQGLIE